jgi:hypothetical protein
MHNLNAPQTYKSTLPGHIILLSHSIILLQVAQGSEAKLCSRLNTPSAAEYVTFACAELLRYWQQQEPSNQDGSD